MPSPTQYLSADTMNHLPPRFLNWRLIDGRKVPCKPDGTVCDAHDPANHMTHDAAVATGLPVAFDVRAEDGLFFLDLDKCAEGSGWKPEAVAIFTSFAGALGEVSTSGTGLHVLGRCNPAMLADRRNKWDGWLEFYTDQRFVAFGGKGWAPIGGTLNWERDWTDNLLRIVPQRPHLGELPEGVDPRYTGPSDDDELLRRAMASGGAGAAFGMKANFKMLWEADPELSRFFPAYDGEGGFDHSSADMALMNHLAFWTGNDMPRMDRLFRRSALMREKYETREDYRRDTVQGAARMTTSVYDKPVAVAAAVAAGGGDGDWYMPIDEMRELFKGCVYIRDLDRIFVPDGGLVRQSQFKAFYGGKMFQMMDDHTKPTSDAWEAFTLNKAYQFPKAATSCFRPDLPTGHITEGGACNTFARPEVEMVAGDVTRFLYVMEKLLPVEDDRRILLSYCASMVQNYGTKFQWSPVLQGAEGNGKSLIYSCLRYAMGEIVTHEPSAKQLGSNFNGWMRRCLLSIVEEVHMRGKMELLDHLKPLLTNPRIKIESKGVDETMADNLTNWVFATNFKDAIVKSRNDRRYCIFFTAQQEEADIFRDFGEDAIYLQETYTWLKGGGYAAVAHYLAHYEIDPRYDPAGSCQRAPRTSSYDEVIEESMSPAESAIVDAIDSDEPGFRGGWVSIHMATKLVQGSGYRLTPKSVAHLLVGMGYMKWGRSPKNLPMEDGKQPVIYVKRGGALRDFTEYVKCQNYPI